MIHDNFIVKKRNINRRQLPLMAQRNLYQNNIEKKKMKLKCPRVIKYFPGISDNEIKRRTGFVTETSMLAFISIVCNGHWNNVIYLLSTLSWYKEWLFYFEFVWGKTLQRWTDAASDMNFSLAKKSLRSIFDRKLDVVLLCRASWPMYVTYKEDKRFTSEQWKIKYGSNQIVMWDDTNVDFNYMPTMSHAQRLTYSSYYGGNCGKGGVFLQFCGYMGAHDLFTGGMSDTEYLIEKKKQQEKNNKVEGILERQRVFQEKDKVNGQVIQFINILDKGY